VIVIHERTKLAKRHKKGGFRSFTNGIAQQKVPFITLKSNARFLCIPTVVSEKRKKNASRKQATVYTYTQHTHTHRSAIHCGATAHEPPWLVRLWFGLLSSGGLFGSVGSSRSFTLCSRGGLVVFLCSPLHNAPREGLA
jgi:hypothetical protein